MDDGPVLHVWPDHAVYLACSLDADTHAHHVAQISLALQGSLEVRVGDLGEWLRVTGVIIAADQPHAVRAANALAQLYLEPESQLGRRLVAVLAGASHRPLPESALQSILPPPAPLLAGAAAVSRRARELRAGLCGVARCPAGREPRSADLCRGHPAARGLPQASAAR